MNHSSCLPETSPPQEQAALREVPDDGQRPLFLRIWTRKEAYVKATGDGLARPFSSFAVSTGPTAELLWADADDAGRWQLHDLPLPGPEFLVAEHLAEH